MINDILKETKNEMEKVVKNFHDELARVRTGRANPSLLDSINVDYCGQKTPLRQLAGIKVPEPRLVVVSPWDKNSLKDIEKAILAADIGVTPQNDGVIIRLPFPPLSEETRRESLKQAKKMAEQYKVGLRGVRHDQLNLIREMEKEKEITEDEKKKGEDKLDKVIGEYTKKIDEILKKKEEEILSI